MAAVPGVLSLSVAYFVVQDTGQPRPPGRVTRESPIRGKGREKGFLNGIFRLTPIA